MRWELALGLMGLAAGGGVVALIASCQPYIDEQPCKDIPANGCPIDDDLESCTDPTCAAVYACDPTTETWTLDHTCPGYVEAGVSDAADAGSNTRDASDIDAPPGAYGGVGCPDLESPDCPLGLALSCPPGQCCDCVDLYVCDNGGWDEWGTCNDGGVLTPAQ